MVQTSPSKPIFLRVSATLVVEAVARLARPQTLLVVVVSSAARHILHAVQVPYENLLAVSLLESSPLGSIAWKWY